MRAHIRRIGPLPKEHEEPERTPMTDDERAVALALGKVNYLPASWDKRFGRDMAALAQQPDAALTEPQRTSLWRLRHRYRRQIPTNVPVAPTP